MFPFPFGNLNQYLPTDFLHNSFVPITNSTKKCFTFFEALQYDVIKNRTRILLPTEMQKAAARKCSIK